MEDPGLWETCDCGKRCQAWGPTISIYTNISDSRVLRSTHSPYDQSYTFFNESCPNGEDVRFSQLYLENVENIALEYINQTIPCFYGEDNQVYLEEFDDINTIIGLSSAMGVVILIVIFCFIKYRKSQKEEVIIAWAQFINKLDPDLISGYNVFGFDFAYIWKRAHCS